MMKANQILTTVASAISMSLVGNVGQAQANCPKAGDLKSFAQITAQAEIFHGCDVTTEVNFGAVFTGKDALEEVIAVAAAQNLIFKAIKSMPANNLSVIFEILSQ